MKKIFAFAAAVMASVSLWAATTVTFTAEEIVAGTAKSKVNVLVGSGQATADKAVTAWGASKVKVISLSSSCSTKGDVKEATSGKSFGFTVPEDATITNVKVHAASNSTSVGKSAILFWEEATPLGDALKGAALLTLVANNEADDAKTWQDVIVPTGARTVMFYKRAIVNDDTNPTTVATAKNYPSSDNQTVNIRDIEITYEMSCAAPADELSITSDAPANLYEGTTINLTISGGNNGTKKVLLDGAEYKDMAWEAVKGEHTFTVSQDKNGEYCSQEAELKLNVLEATPVTSVTVSGPDKGFVGQEITLTATAEGATQWRWLNKEGSVLAGEDSNTFKFTPDATGEWRFSCQARNQFNVSGGDPNWVPSEIKIMNISIASGAIMEYKVQTGSSDIDKDIVAGGVIGATGHQKTKKDGKLSGEGKYLSFQLNGFKFLEDDTVLIFVKPESDNVPAKLTLSSDLGVSDIIGFAEDLTKDNSWPVKIALTKDAEKLFLARTNTVAQNPIVDSIAVIRPVDDGSPVLSVNPSEISLHVTAATIQAFTKITFKGKHLSAGVYNIVCPVGFSILPDKVKVETDGKLNQEVSVSYTSSTDQAYAETTISLTISGKTATVKAAYSADLTKNFITKSLNIEQLVLDHGKGYDIKAALVDAGWKYSDIDELDSLDNSKSERNYGYLGLKLKKTGARIEGWLKAGQTFRFKLGAIQDFLMRDYTTELLPADYANTTVEAAEGGKYSQYTPGSDQYIVFELTSTKDKRTAVIKQLMVNGDAIQEVKLPGGSAIDNTAAENKAVKTFEDGQLIIIKNGVKYNAQGTIVK